MAGSVLLLVPLSETPAGEKKKGRKINVKSGNDTQKPKFPLPQTPHFRWLSCSWWLEAGKTLSLACLFPGVCCERLHCRDSVPSGFTSVLPTFIPSKCYRPFSHRWHTLRGTQGSLGYFENLNSHFITSGRERKTSLPLSAS